MTLFELALLWYGFIGAVWGYLVLHEEMTNTNLEVRFSRSSTLSSVWYVLGLYVTSLLFWPVSLYKCVAAGRIREMFR